MEYLVTGGAGFIGSHLVDELIKQGCRTIVVDDFSSGKEENLVHHKNTKHLLLYRKNVCDDLTEVFENNNIEIVFHLAALPDIQSSIDHPLETHKVNLDGTLNVLSASKKFGVRRLVFASSAAIYGDCHKGPLREDLTPCPISPYALDKVASEYYSKLFTTLYGFETISLRYFNVFGPRQNVKGGRGPLVPKFFTLINKHKVPTIYGDGKQTRDFVYVSDAVEAAIFAAHSKNKNCIGKVVNIGSGINVSINEIARKIIALTNKRVTSIYAPPVIEPRHSVADISRANLLFGWKPKVSLETGLRRTYRYFHTIS